MFLHIQFVPVGFFKHKIETPLYILATLMFTSSAINFIIKMISFSCAEWITEWISTKIIYKIMTKIGAYVLITIYMQDYPCRTYKIIC